MAGIPPIEPYPLPGRSDLPVNTASWKVDPRRAVLLVHDMQRYFLQALPVGLRDCLVHRCGRLRAHSVATGMPVAYTAQPGGMTEEQRGLLQDFWGSGMRVDPADRAIVPELTPGERDWSMTKWRYSAFARTDLEERMRRHGRDQLVLCGVYAHVGVLATAVDSFSRDIETFMVADAVADFSHEHHMRALEYAAQRCAVVLTSEQVVE